MRPRMSGTCPICGEGWCRSSWSGPAEPCACADPPEPDGAPDPLADEGPSDARELAREYD